MNENITWISPKFRHIIKQYFPFCKNNTVLPAPMFYIIYSSSLNYMFHFELTLIYLNIFSPMWKKLQVLTVVGFWGGLSWGPKDVKGMPEIMVKLRGSRLDGVQVVWNWNQRIPGWSSSEVGRMESWQTLLYCCFNGNEKDDWREFWPHSSCAHLKYYILILFFSRFGIE